ncbi:MAG: gliding motility-associated C-terminal domain-containing protein [Flavobacteriales bacterium]|nr:gliding motility-associated C-terminal domain-containing protein [Flavobacteriales bacterium]
MIHELAYYRPTFNRLFRFMLMCIFLSTITIGLKAQTTYKMSNNWVYDCKGILTDSEANKVNSSWYASSEDYVFTVSVGGASSILIQFMNTFDIEKDADYLKIYDGKDTNATLLKKFDNANKPSGSISTTDSMVTFYFHSDKFVNGGGFELKWEGKITKITQPKFNPIANPKCDDLTIRVSLDQKFNCDSIKARNFMLSGTLSTAVSSVKAINCDANNMSNTFDVTFVSGLDQSGNYMLDFNSTFTDRCDSVWQINAKLNFKITDCPIVVTLSAADYVICKGKCTKIDATITGGNPQNYLYTWIPGGLSGTPPKNVCPTSTTEYILKVSDGVSIPGFDTISIRVIDPPVAPKDTVICQSNPPYDLKASPQGGIWSGIGITDSIAGTFSPAVSKNGTFTLTYTLNGCSDDILITVRGINAGLPNASCPSAPPFMVSNFSPAGGTWSGPNISSSGIITPPDTAGSFVVTYTWNGCSDTKIVNIDAIIIDPFDTICQSVINDTFTFQPMGGTWTGPSVTNSRIGINSPNAAGAGDHIYIYRINGCRDTLKRNIQAVDARYNEITCPDGGLHTLPAGIPAGGLWSGKGIIDPVAGIFDPDTFSVPGKSTFVSTILTYTSPNGCRADKIMYLRYSRFYVDTVFNCVSDTNYLMRYAFIRSDPWNMYFTGSNAILGNTVYNQMFSPSLAGKGTLHQIIGEANGCRDTLIIKIHPRANIQKDTNFCIADKPFQLFNGEGSGTFSGKGITNGKTGLFNPAVAKAGVHKILFDLPGKCTDTILITVRGLPIVDLSGLNNSYCYRDTLILLSLSPPGGNLTGNGIVGNSFNPKLAGSGKHTLSYSYGTGNCVSKISKDVVVQDTLKVKIMSDKDSVCVGSTVTLTAKPAGGTGNYNYNWSTGQGNVNSIFVSTKSPLIVKLNINDGCSEGDSTLHLVYVHPEIKSTALTSPIQCYGQPGFIQLKMNGTGPYSYKWNTTPELNTPDITVQAGNTYRVIVTNMATGCIYDTSVNLPGYPPIKAFFNYSPNDACLISYNALLQIINLSQGGITGYWDMGDSTFYNYDPKVNPQHLYDGSRDYYTIKLVIENNGNCKDSFSRKVCIKEITDFEVPSAFSPNGDGINDVFKIEYASFLYSSMSIYNRWGERVFYTEDFKEGWDGTYLGETCQVDYYFYAFKYKGKKTANKLAKGVVYLIR